MILSRLIGPPSSWAISQQFHSSQEKSIYVRLYKNNMDGLNSFFPVEKGLQHILSNDSLALIYDLSVSHMEFKCKVKYYSCKVVLNWRTISQTTLFIDTDSMES